MNPITRRGMLAGAAGAVSLGLTGQLRRSGCGE